MPEMSLRTFALDVADVHGLKHIAKPGCGILRRTIWMIFFLAAVVFALYEITLCVVYFAERHHVTKMEVNYTTTIDFPAVTICNVNKYRESALTVDDVAHVGIHLGIVDENYDIINSHLYTDDFINRMNAINWSSLAIDDDYYNMTNLTYRTGHQAEDMILQPDRLLYSRGGDQAKKWVNSGKITKCEFSGQECSIDNFTHVFTHHGNCYTFNKWIEGVSHLTSTRAGAGNGLKLTLNIESEEYTPSNDLDGDSMDAGIKILVHPRNEPPFVKELGFAAPPGFHSFVSIKKESIYGLPAPYGECLKDGVIKYYDHYSLTACRIELETKAVEEYCGCRLVEQPGNGTWPVCSANQTHECAHQTLVDYVNGLIDIGEECRDPCDIEDYPHSVTLTKLRENFLQKSFESTHNMTEAYIVENVVAISIFYEALNMQTITQLPDTDIIVLISQVGGNLGLCVGASILTIIQLFEFIFDYLAALCCRSNKTKVGAPPVTDSTELPVTDAWTSKTELGVTPVSQ